MDCDDYRFHQIQANRTFGSYAFSMANLRDPELLHCSFLSSFDDSSSMFDLVHTIVLFVADGSFLVMFILLAKRLWTCPLKGDV